MDINELQQQYRTGERTPAETVTEVFDHIETDETNAWISVRPESAVRSDAKNLASPAEQPLYGVPFAVKDNIDCAGMDTTAGCPAYAYEAEADATVVSKLVDAGALLIGKTNLDQFASGLVGTRTPYGVCRNVHNTEYISGGSSSGSAVAVGQGHVAFALGTDTAGSGRIPAAFNGLVGLKPTRGMVSTTGVVPACESLDCVAIFAHSCRDALRVEEVAAGFDPADPYSRRELSLTTTEGERTGSELSKLTVGVPDPTALEFFGDDEAEALYRDTVETVRRAVGDVVTVDFEVFTKTAELLYGGPWVAERLSAVETFVSEQPETIHPVVREILTGGREYSATQTFDSLHTLKRLKRRREKLFATHDLDLLATPTAGTIYTIEEVLEKPIKRNSTLGYYTDYVNLLDLAAVAIPTGEFDAGPGFGLTLLGEAGRDRFLATVGDKLTSATANTGKPAAHQ